MAAESVDIIENFEKDPPEKEPDSVPDSAPEGKEKKKGENETDPKPKESGVRKRIKINLPGIYSTDKTSKKPPDYAWAQQRLPACRPVYTGKTIFVLFSIIGLLFVVLGAIFLSLNLQLQEYTVSYTDCPSSFPNETEADLMNCTLPDAQYATCSDYVANLSQFNREQRLSLRQCPCYCQVVINVEEDMSPPVHVYYQMDNYYQNHRRYVNSWSPRSLTANDINEPRSDCSPFDRVGSSDTPYFPCGLIANSFFNDTLSLRGLVINSTDIAWKTDRDTRFKNPPRDRNPFDNDQIETGNTVLPPNWLRLIDHGQRNESFMVWFRVAAFPKFRKLYGRITPPNDQPLRAGNYTIDIVYNYPVSQFDGGKSFVLAEVSRLGARNLFIGIAYIVTGALSIVLGSVLLIVNLTCSKWNLKHERFLNRDW